MLTTWKLKLLQIITVDIYDYIFVEIIIEGQSSILINDKRKYDEDKVFRVSGKSRGKWKIQSIAQQISFRSLTSLTYLVRVKQLVISAEVRFERPKQNAQWKQRNTGHECICCESGRAFFLFFSVWSSYVCFSSEATLYSALYCSLRCGHFFSICFLLFFCVS